MFCVCVECSKEYEYLRGTNTQKLCGSCQYKAKGSKLCPRCGNRRIKNTAQRCIDCYLSDVRSITIGEIRSMYKDKTALAVAAKIRGYGATIYKNSGKPKYCINCGYSKFFEVCHIRPVKDFPDTATMAEVHALDNLIALCCNCHWEHDHGMLTLEEILRKENGYE